MSIIDEMTAGRRTNPLQRDIYLAEQLLALADIVDAQFKVMRRRIEVLESLLSPLHTQSREPKS